MKDTIKLYWMAFNTALQAKFEYRVDFLLGVVTSCMLQVAALAYIYVIFHQTPNLNGWSRDQVILLMGMTAAALGTSELFFNHIWMLPYYIVMGELDRLLTYPVNSLYFLLVTRPELHSFGNLVTGFTLISVELWRMNCPWYDWLAVPLLVVCGGVIYTAALVIAGALSFKFLGPTSMTLMIPHSLLQATRYPLSIYPWWLQYGLMLVIPYGVFHYLPASALLGKDFGPWLLPAAPLATALFIWEAQRVWQWGLNKYESTGS